MALSSAVISKKFVKFESQLSKTISSHQKNRLTSSPSSFLHESSKLMCLTSVVVVVVVVVVAMCRICSASDKSMLDPCICI